MKKNLSYYWFNNYYCEKFKLWLFNLYQSLGKYTWYKVTGLNKEINLIKYINLKKFENLSKYYYS